ncbi:MULTISPECIES: 3-hydroxyacyl-CoA dehydrogenase family protein [Microvirgula]|uniref:3-hydroxyacyl-CoA dehydrogenase family protein n=1 Tax=Microvirgula TaxID=57479 RepID=UPI00048D38E8|nr:MULTISPECIES: 3-hydroxyacyl-CoA dehydrogenase NAD-binding domain-containing protein [Microvirgula]RAS11737.1 3-hydroxyacyl-CoA dehydrogenase [Microvirgula sp. AG722]
MEIRQVGVIGAGQMGGGIAQVCAQAGLAVRLCDIDPAQQARAMAQMRRSLDKLAAGQAGLEPDAVLARVATVSGPGALAGCELVVEAASEQLALKLRLLGEAAAAVGPDAIIASNTSSISLTRLAAAVPSPQRVIGMHFMNPVPLMPLVEIIRAEQTDDATHRAIEALTTRLGKTPVTVGDAPGFVSNRVLMPMINEAAFCVHDGVADPAAVDAVMTLGMRHPLGPLALADLIGLDTCVAILDVLYSEFRDSKYRVCPLLARYVAAGRLGRKSGRGFYDYTDRS